jgi:hypothetical protein
MALEVLRRDIAILRNRNAIDSVQLKDVISRLTLAEKNLVALTTASSTNTSYRISSDKMIGAFYGICFVTDGISPSTVSITCINDAIVRFSDGSVETVASHDVNITTSGILGLQVGLEAKASTRYSLYLLGGNDGVAKGMLVEDFPNATILVIPAPYTVGRFLGWVFINMANSFIASSTLGVGDVFTTNFGTKDLELRFLVEGSSSVYSQIEVNPIFGNMGTEFTSHVFHWEWDPDSGGDGFSMTWTPSVDPSTWKDVNVTTSLRSLACKMGSWTFPTIGPYYRVTGTGSASIWYKRYTYHASTFEFEI